MTRIRVTSSSIRSIGYDPQGMILEIELRNGGIYQYFRVPAKEHDSLLKAESIGRYYAKVIKPNYKFRRVK